MSQEPVTTPSILATIPDLLKEILVENISNHRKRTTTSVLVSSNSLANRFIFERWGIRSSQRKHFKNLFSKIREQCRILFRNYERRGSILGRVNTKTYQFSVFTFDEVRGNLILGFVPDRMESPYP